MQAITQTTRCPRCGRVLTSARSIRTGYGKGCWAKVRAARTRLENYRDHQLDSATEAVEDGAVAHLRDGIHLVISTDGTRTHRTTHTHCTCHAGIRSARCWHTAAVAMHTGHTPPAPAPRVFDLAA